MKHNDVNWHKRLSVIAEEYVLSVVGEDVTDAADSVVPKVF